MVEAVKQNNMHCVLQKLYFPLRLKGDCRSISYNQYWEDVTDAHIVLLHKVLDLLSLLLKVVKDAQKSFCVVHSGQRCGLVLFFSILVFCLEKKVFPSI